MARFEKQQTMSSQQDYLNDYSENLPAERAAEIKTLDSLIRTWQPDLQVKIWHSMGYPIIGYGEATYQSGRGQTNKWFVIGLATHKSYLSLYIWGLIEQKYLLEIYEGRLGDRVKTGKSCLNFNKSAELDLDVLKEVIAKAVTLNKK